MLSPEEHQLKVDERNQRFRKAEINRVYSAIKTIEKRMANGESSANIQIEHDVLSLKEIRAMVQSYMNDRGYAICWDRYGHNEIKAQWKPASSRLGQAYFQNKNEAAPIISLVILLWAFVLLIVALCTA